MIVRDPEIVLELRDEPELLAVADGLAEVLAAYRPTRRRRRLEAALAAGAGVVAAAVAVLALVLTGNDVQPRLVDRALAAVGDAPVLHAVVRREDAPESVLIELSTGRRIAKPRVTVTEIWFDKERALEHTITRSTGRPTQDELATPDGITSESGPVWTCARIAAHPLEATRARVSCNFNGENGTTPRQIPELPPTLDPALAGFVDGYREALASGAARKIGEGIVQGQHVFWLEFRLPDLGDPTGQTAETQQSEQVAVASDTYRPILVRSLIGGVAGPGYTVLAIETVSRAEADFSEPKLLPPEQRATGTRVVVTGELTLDQAADELGTRALWAGPEVAGLKLAAVQRRVVTTSFARGSGLAPRVTPVVALVYGEIHGKHPVQGSVEITESISPTGSWSLPDPEAPPPGFVAVNRFGWGFLRVGGLYVEISRVAAGANDSLVAEVARRLVAVPRAG
jgi:hypothetical protein